MHEKQSGRARAKTTAQLPLTIERIGGTKSGNFILEEEEENEAFRGGSSALLFKTVSPTAELDGAVFRNG